MIECWNRMANPEIWLLHYDMVSCKCCNRHTRNHWAPTAAETGNVRALGMLNYIICKSEKNVHHCFLEIISLRFHNLKIWPALCVIQEQGAVCRAEERSRESYTLALETVPCDGRRLFLLCTQCQGASTLRWMNYDYLFIPWSKYAKYPCILYEVSIHICGYHII